MFTRTPVRTSGLSSALVLIMCLSSHANASQFLFQAHSKDGQIFSVRTDDERGKYRWYLGAMGEFDARIKRGTRVSLTKPDMRGSVGLDEFGDVVLTINGTDTVLQEGAFGYECYVKTLEHHGVYRAEDFQRDYIFRQSGTDGSLWSARATPKKGLYRWYMGGLGRGVAEVRGSKVEVETGALKATMVRDKVGDILFTATTGESLHFAEGTLGYGVFKATMVHAGKWKASKGKRETIFQDATTEGAIWKVVTGAKRGEYTWYMGELGRSTALLKGRNLSLKGDTFRGKIYVSTSNEVVLESAENENFLSPGSLGFEAYKATLTHNGNWREGLGVVDYLFRDASTDGSIWAVKKGARKGLYDWDIGQLGRVKASVRGTRVDIASKRVQGKVFVNADNELIFSVAGQETLLQELSLGFSAYKATLRDAGTWKDSIGQHDYLFKDVTADGQMWTVRATSSRGRYIWYMGQMGRAEARARGSALTLKSDAFFATMDLGPKGDPIIKFYSAPGGTLIQEQVLHPGSAGERCYNATRAHLKAR